MPLLISVPGYQKGGKTTSIAELVDVYPTLSELAGLNAPAGLEGKSLVPILKNPAATVKRVAISQYPRGKSLGYDHKSEIMGYSIFDGRYRYTRWQLYEKPEEIVARELYDHKAGRLAAVNLASDEKHRSKLKEMDDLMNAELRKYSRKKSTP